MIRSCFPRDWSSTAMWCAAIVATYTFKVEGDSLRSNLSCRKESTNLIGHLRGSTEEHQSANRLQGINLPARGSSGLSDSVYHQWQITSVCHVPSRSHTWRFQRYGRRCHMVPSPSSGESAREGLSRFGVSSIGKPSKNQFAFPRAKVPPQCQVLRHWVRLIFHWIRLIFPSNISGSGKHKHTRLAGDALVPCRPTGAWHQSTMRAIGEQMTL